MTETVYAFKVRQKARAHNQNFSLAVIEITKEFPPKISLESFYITTFVLRIILNNVQKPSNYSN